MNGKLNLVAAGFALTALTYGLARFAYGLLLPQIRADLALDATQAGLISGSAFAAYCIGISATLVAGSRLGPRWLAVLAGIAATSGLALAATAQSFLTFGVAIALGGLSTGLTSPPLAIAVSRCIEEKARPRANGAINAGTAAGIIVSGLAFILLPTSWRSLYALFASLGIGTTVWLYFAIPALFQADRMQSRSVRQLNRKGIRPLCISAFLAGAASTAIWTFGANTLDAALHFSDVQVAIAWIVLGLGGMLGLSTGGLTGRFGLARVHRCAIGGMALAIVGLAAAVYARWIGFPVMALFGLAYIVSSGAFLLWGIELYEDRPALGLGIPFLMLAIGQTAGAPLYGVLLDQAGSATALGCFAAVMVAALMWAPLAGQRTPAIFATGTTR